MEPLPYKRTDNPRFVFKTFKPLLLFLCDFNIRNVNVNLGHRVAGHSLNFILYVFLHPLGDLSYLGVLLYADVNANLDSAVYALNLNALESGIKYSYADIREGVSANKTESNFESTSSESKQTYITVKTADGGEQALLVTTEMPEVRGVAIVCEGGDDGETNEKIQNAVTAALNITSKRVYVAGGKSYEKR